MKTGFFLKNKIRVYQFVARFLTISPLRGAGSKTPSRRTTRLRQLKVFSNQIISLI